MSRKPRVEPDRRLRVRDLRERFGEILDVLEQTDGWVTARIRELA
jgi:hypothetical protein